MAAPLRKRIFKAASWLIAGYILLFGFRVFYSYSLDRFDNEDGYVSDFFDNFNASTRNFASDKFSRKSESYSKSTDGNEFSQDLNPNAATVVSVDQKYEKTATVKTKSVKFDSDEKKFREMIKSTNSVIQFEQNIGNKGDRSIHWMVGVVPEKFDSFYVAAQKIGKVKSAEVVKTDMTSEFKNLNARRISLENTRTSLIELKKQTGRIEEYMNLENRILAIDSMLQELGVLLGDFSAENEFCTVRLSLVEGHVPVPTSMMHRLKVSFEWSVQWYIGLLIGLSLAFGAAILFVFVLIQVKKLEIGKWWKGMNGEDKK